MYLVIDVGGTYTKYGYYHEDGTCLKTSKRETVKTNITDFYNSLVSLVRKDVEGIAISMPGIINSQTGHIHAITLLPFLTNHNIKQELEVLTQLPVSVENDAKCATLGEIWKGSLQNVCNGFMIVFGSGIGGTCVFNGEILRSSHHKAGEVGSLLMPLDLDYREMTNFGHSYNAVKLIHDLAGFIGCEENGEVVFQYLPEHLEAMEHLRSYAKRIAVMIYNLDYLFDLEVVSIGGAISQQTLFIETIQQEFSHFRKLYKEDMHEPQIIACHFQNDANLLGALFHFKRQ